MKNEDNLITLSGDKLGTPLQRAFFQAADFKAGLVAAALSFSYHAATSGNAKMSVAMAVSTLVMNAVMSGLMRGLEKTVHGTRFKKGLCIDTDPGNSTPPKGRDHLNARTASIMYGAGAALCLVAGVHKIISNPADAVSTLNILSGFTRLLQGANRFDKVVKGDWTLVDRPPEKKTVSTLAALPAQP